MKKLLLLFLLIFGYQTIFSQDIIFLLSGVEIESKVLEVGIEEIKYKKFSNLNGPTYTELKMNVFMIKYENGEKDVFDQEIEQVVIQDTLVKEYQEVNSLNIVERGFTTHYYSNDEKVTKEKFVSILSTNSQAIASYNSGKSLNTASLIIGIPSAVMFGWQLGTIIGGGDANYAVFGIGAAGFTASLIMTAVGNAKIKESLIIFNNSKSVGFNIGQNGLGIAYNF